MKRDVRLLAAAITGGSILALGLVVRGLPAQERLVPDAASRTAASLRPGARQQAALWEEADAVFRQGVAFLQAGEHRHAIAAFRRVLGIAPRMTEARVNIGFAYLGLGETRAAGAEFAAAIAERPGQANAHYGLALARREAGDSAGAVAAMRDYLRLSPPADPFREKAEALVREWTR